MSANTFRAPGLTAKLATTLDHLSDGRAVLGLGGGWFEREHDAFGIDFGSGLRRAARPAGRGRRDHPASARRRDRHRTTGRSTSCTTPSAEPRPVQARLPILIGGSGKTKTLRTTARYADLWNAYGDPERIAELGAVLRRALRRDRPGPGRDRADRDDAHGRCATRAEAARAAWDELAAIHGLVGRTGSDGTDRGLGVRRVAGPRSRTSCGDSPRPAWTRSSIVFRHPFDLETIGGSARSGPRSRPERRSGRGPLLAPVRRHSSAARSSATTDVTIARA